MPNSQRAPLPEWRQLPIGVEVAPDGTGAHARIWAPDLPTLDVVVERPDGSTSTALTRDEAGYHAGAIAGMRAGDRYRFRTPAGLFPDPTSRSQPDGPHGSSMLIDPSTFKWTDGEWRGISIQECIIYELHIGTFTAGRTFRSAIERLDDLADLGVTAIEIMPVAEFPGRFGWGYDGVDLFAPAHIYGTPDDFRALVDAAHARRLAVILDVVYNHLGPDGNYLGQFAAKYAGKGTEWGDGFNLDGDGSPAVRELVTANAAYWIREFHLDGLRLDATQQIFDSSPTHIIQEIARAAHDAAPHRTVVVVGENEPQHGRLITPVREGGYGLDALWNDDFHHAAAVAATGSAEAYLSGYRGSPQEFVSAAKYGFLFQGQYFTWQGLRRGSPGLAMPGHRFINYLENHDQVGNSPTGRRLDQLAAPGVWRALTALLFLGPAVPMLFQGQEFAASAPFSYFADHPEPLASQVKKGRDDFMRQFPSFAAAGDPDLVPSPAALSTMERSTVDWTERQRHPHTLALHKALIALRKSDAVLAARRMDNSGTVDGAVLTDRAFVIRYRSHTDDRLLVINLGGVEVWDPAPEPLLAPPSDTAWHAMLSTDDPAFGGSGTPALESEHGWRLPAQCAVFLAPVASHG